MLLAIFSQTMHAMLLSAYLSKQDIYMVLPVLVLYTDSHGCNTQSLTSYIRTQAVCMLCCRGGVIW